MGVMMSVPVEFTAEAVKESSLEAFRPYGEFLRSAEPYSSIFINNQWLTPPKPDAELEWGKGWYYDTTVARKHEYWKNIKTPQATKDIVQLR